MEIAYFITASLLCIWMYLRTRRTAKKIRTSRRKSGAYLVSK